MAQSGQADNQILTSVLLWMRYLEAGGGASFAEISAFISTHANWPLQVTLAVRAEAVMDPAMDPALVLEWFEHHPPNSGVGMVRLAQAHHAMGQTEAAEAWAVQAWTSTRLEPETEAALLDTFALALTPRHHEARLDHLIWQGMADAARRVLPLVSENAAAVGRARIALMLRLAH